MICIYIYIYRERERERRERIQAVEDDTTQNIAQAMKH